MDTEERIPIPGLETPAGVRAFRMQLAVLIIVYTVGVYAGIFLMARSLLLESLRAQGESYFDLVLDTRTWNADHGGVWIVKDEGVETNPFLALMGIEADVRTEDGRTLTLRNPSAMTREISVITSLHSGVSFHITAEEAVDPGNLPDAWEQDALDAFEQGETQVYGATESDGVDMYRYMEPLTVDESCLGCHESRGYSTGERRGGVSISIPMGSVVTQIRMFGWILFGLAGITVGGALSISQLLINRLQRRIDDANHILHEAAVTDPLTSILNRRAVMIRLAEELERVHRSGEPLSVIIADLDHFKNVNDAHGHAAGDCALREFVRRTRGVIRPYDAFGRIGGEEFLVVAPDTDGRSALHLAERVVEVIGASDLSVCGVPTHLTASVGVAALQPDDDIDTLLARADAALYRAKYAGRNRAEIADG